MRKTLLVKRVDNITIEQQQLQQRASERLVAAKWPP